MGSAVGDIERERRTSLFGDDEPGKRTPHQVSGV
jgi:hypothetical protein